MPRPGLGSAPDPRDTRFCTMGRSKETMGSPPDTLRQASRSHGQQKQGPGRRFRSHGASPAMPPATPPRAPSQKSKQFRDVPMVPFHLPMVPFHLPMVPFHLPMPSCHLAMVQSALSQGGCSRSRGPGQGTGQARAGVELGKGRDWNLQHHEEKRGEWGAALTASIAARGTGLSGELAEPPKPARGPPLRWNRGSPALLPLAFDELAPEVPLGSQRVMRSTTQSEVGFAFRARAGGRGAAPETRSRGIARPWC